MNAKIEIQTVPPMHLACITVIGAHTLPEAFGKLMQWASANGLAAQHPKFLTIYHDSLKITPERKVRMSACLTLTEPVPVSGEINAIAFDPGKCVVGSFEIPLSEFGQAWTGLFMWMNENNYKKAEGDPFEIYHNNFSEHPEKKCIVDFCIPIL